jgi:hypothetical protein
MLVARREPQLVSLANEIAETTGQRPIILPVDLSADDVVEKIAAKMIASGTEVQFVVNNAGFGLWGAADRLDIGEQIAMIDVNVRTLTHLSLRFVDSIARLKGGILNVSSVAGLFPGPGMSVYYATKAYSLSFTEALSYELAPRGIRVTVLCPGPVPTELHERAGIPFKGHVSWLSQPADRVALEAYEGLMSGKRMVIPGFANKLIAALIPRLPRAVAMSLTSSRAAIDKGPR